MGHGLTLLKLSRFLKLNVLIEIVKLKHSTLKTYLIKTFNFKNLFKTFNFKKSFLKLNVLIEIAPL